MKKINNIKTVLAILILTITTTSCGDFEPVIFDPENGQTFVSFGEDRSDIQFFNGIPETGFADIPIVISTISDVARTVQVEVDLELSSSSPSEYTFNPTVTIPPGEFVGTLRVDAIFNNLQFFNTTTVLIITSIGEEGGTIQEGTHTVRMRRLG